MQFNLEVNKMITAVLHYEVEDTDWTIENMETEGFDKEVLEAIKLLTHVKKVPYKKILK
jgi:(p)ppGpp synthase/HD superfamily hydrolase